MDTPGGTIRLDWLELLLLRTKCPDGHSKGVDPCGYRSEDLAPFFCIPRVRATGLRPKGDLWRHYHFESNDPKIEVVLYTGMECPICGADKPFSWV